MKLAEIQLIPELFPKKPRKKYPRNFPLYTEISTEIEYHKGGEMSPRNLAILLLSGLLLSGCNLSVSQGNSSLTPTPEIKQELKKENTNMKQYTTIPPMSVDKNKIYTAIMDTTKGKMTFELFVKETPITVNNFVFLSRDGFYNGTKFHRIMSGFMIQGGDPQGNGTGSPGYKFNDEPITRDYKRGTLAMANSGLNTNGSQFFIMHKDYPLPKNYVIFGELTTGLDALDVIANTPVIDNGMGETSKPTEDILINSLTIEEK